MRKKREMVLWVLLPALCLAGSAAAIHLPPAAAGDQVPAVLGVPVSDPPPATAERAPLVFAWAVDPAAELDLSPRPQSARSREYWVGVAGSDFAKGVEIFTAGPGALVRLQPAAGVSGAEASGQPIDLRTLRVATPDGAVRPVTEAADALATAEQLAAAEAPFAEGTSAFRLRPELGAGRFVLSSDALADSGGRYVVHVFDRGSDLELVVESARADYLAGNALQLSVRLVAGGAPLVADGVEGFVTSPDGKSARASFRGDGTGVFRATLQLPSRTAGGVGGLWELVASARGRRDGHLALRSGRVGFAVATPTARLGGEVRVEDAGKTGGRAAHFDVEVAAAGRYELRGVLFGTGADGVRRPAAIAHAAAWLEPGHGALALRFDRAVLATSGLVGPWEVRGLELRDQGRLGLLERRAGTLELAP